jgi:hypothetical protein
MGHMLIPPSKVFRAMSLLIDVADGVKSTLNDWRTYIGLFEHIRSILLEDKRSIYGLNVPQNTETELAPPYDP